LCVSQNVYAYGIPEQKSEEKSLQMKVRIQYEQPTGKLWTNMMFKGFSWIFFGPLRTISTLSDSHHNHNTLQ